MSYKIVVMSCDKNDDLWLPFHHCMEKYWKNHPEIIYSTETKINPYYKTICRNLPINKWTKRVYETIKDLKCDNILLMVDDLFLRDFVDSKKIDILEKELVSNIVAFNFEFKFDMWDIPYKYDLYIRNPIGKFQTSCMCQMWNMSVMKKLFNVSLDPWQFEKQNKTYNFLFLISKSGNYLNWGKRRDDWRWGIVKGKWTQECKEFLDKECIDIDYSIRGFID